MASLRAVRRRGCGRKQQYPSEGDARRAAASLASETGSKLNVYRCSFCSRYHVGNMPRGILREIAERRVGRA